MRHHDRVADAKRALLDALARELLPVGGVSVPVERIMAQLSPRPAHERADMLAAATQLAAEFAAPDQAQELEEVIVKRLDAAGFHRSFGTESHARMIAETVIKAGWRPFVESAITETQSADERHDCATDDRDGDYGLLADVVIEAFNPPDTDRAEEAILVDAVYAARDFIVAHPCACLSTVIAEEDAGGACRRCLALGRLGNQVISR